MKNRIYGIVLIVSLSWMMQATRAASIVVGNHVLIPNKAGQSIDIVVQGGDLVSGVDLFAQIGDGGPELAGFGLPRGQRGPAITSVELIEGTIFDGVVDVPTNLGASELRQVALQSLALIGSTETVPADGILAKLVLDTTGFFGGEWGLLLSNVLPFEQLNGPYETNFAGVPAMIENGQVVVAMTIGDFDENGSFGHGDIDALTHAIRAGETETEYDLNSDNELDGRDRQFWVEQIARTYFGDSNLDGEFNTTDFVEVFQAAEYEDGIEFNSSWQTGDWNGDLEFSTADFVLAFQSRGFEQGPRDRTLPVPEPQPCQYAVQVILALGAFLRQSNTWTSTKIGETPTRHHMYLTRDQPLRS